MLKVVSDEWRDYSISATRKLLGPCPHSGSVQTLVAEAGFGWAIVGGGLHLVVGLDQATAVLFGAAISAGGVVLAAVISRIRRRRN